MSLVSVAVLREHIDYSAWASRRLVEMLDRIPVDHLAHDFQTADRSILGTLVHVFGADRIWLSRVSGETSNPFLTQADYDLKVLQIDWPLLYGKWRKWVGQLSDETAAQPIAYRDMKGNAYVNPAWEIVLHVVNHATHHRGQAAGFLRSLGHTPPPLDLIRFYRER
jgi:uncharacterized damage-inducible protein DinB